MARKARIKSATGIYHVMLRGEEELFDTRESTEMFLSILDLYVKEQKAELYAYSVLSDRIHLVIGEGSRSLSELIKAVSIRYARYFNGKRGTNGRLFYGRFQSEPLETQERLSACVDFVNGLADIFMESGTAATSLDQYRGGEGICTRTVRTSGKMSELFMEEYRFMNIAYVGRFIKAHCGHSRGEDIGAELKKSILDDFLSDGHISRRCVCEFFGWDGLGTSDEVEEAAQYWTD